MPFSTVVFNQNAKYLNTFPFRLQTRSITHTHRHRRARQRDKSQFSTSRIQWRCRDDNLVKKSAPIPSENIISLVAWLDYVFTPGKTSPVPDYMDLHGKSRWECSLNFPEEIADFSHLCFTCFLLLKILNILYFGEFYYI